MHLDQGTTVHYSGGRRILFHSLFHRRQFPERGSLLHRGRNSKCRLSCKVLSRNARFWYLCYPVNCRRDKIVRLVCGQIPMYDQFTFLYQLSRTFSSSAENTKIRSQTPVLKRFTKATRNEVQHGWCYGGIFVELAIWQTVRTTRKVPP